MQVPEPGHCQWQTLMRGNYTTKRGRKCVVFTQLALLHVAGLLPHQPLTKRSLRRIPCRWMQPSTGMTKIGARGSVELAASAIVHANREIWLSICPRTMDFH